MHGIRVASHAGTWYCGEADGLRRELEMWINSARVTEGTAKAIISPHAGYSYSGPTAAWAYKHIDPTAGWTRVVLLGPSHHAYIEGCALPCSDSYATPIGSIPIDTAVISSLSASHLFDTLTPDSEEAEHSLEMQLPYIRQVFIGKDITLVPIMVGQLNSQQEESYARVLKPLFEDEHTVFVVSSDFCHWGARFRFTPYDPSKGEIWQSIEAMDSLGMSLITSGDSTAFREYLRETGNTICGRNPICLLLATMKGSTLRTRTKFVKYDQSEHVTSQRGSSVSYAAAVVSLEGR